MCINNAQKESVSKIEVDFLISPKLPKMFQKLIFLQIYLHICEKSCTFAAESRLKKVRYLQKSRTKKVLEQ